MCSNELACHAGFGVSPYLQTEVASLQHKRWRVVLAAPGGAGPNDCVMQPWHKVPQVVASCCRYAAVEPLLCCELIQITDKLDRHLRDKHKRQ